MSQPLPPSESSLPSPLPDPPDEQSPEPQLPADDGRTSHLIEVAFKGNRKEFYLWNDEMPPPPKAFVVVDAERGEDVGSVHAVGDLAAKRAAGCSHGPGQEPVNRAARRLASSSDVDRLRDLREQDESARRKAIERVRASGLAMKISDAEWRWDRRKLTLYFTAERRIDFRDLVRDLASMFRTRIELKQIGVRDEAKRLSGIGRCGREYCSASWLPELRPVNLGVAKDQRLSLNPLQISGACGRLMCCLRYEHDFYVRQRRRFPKEGRLFTTTLGEEKVFAIDIFRERVTLRNAEGELRVLSLPEFRRETGVGATIEMPLDEETVTSMEGLTEEVILLQDTSERPMWKARQEKERGDAGASQTADARRLPVVPANERREEPNELDDETEEDDDPKTADSPSADSRGAEPSEGVGGERRRRRRRGRRGGRRGKGGDQPPPNTSGTSGPA